MATAKGTSDVPLKMMREKYKIFDNYLLEWILLIIKKKNKFYYIYEQKTITARDWSMIKILLKVNEKYVVIINVSSEDYSKGVYIIL